MPDYLLDLRGVSCPLNFVRTRLFMDKLSPGDTLQVLLDPGEPVESVRASIEAEGHKVTDCLEQSQGHFSLYIRKAGN